MTLRLLSTDPDAGFHIARTPLGCVLRGAGGPPRPIEVLQGTVLALGATVAAFALSLGVDGLASAGLAAALASLSVLLVWFATRGASVELHFDLVHGELRELVRHRIGRATLLSRHPIGPRPWLSVHHPAEGRSALILREGPRPGGLCIVEGPDDVVLALRRHLDPELRLHAPQPEALAA